MKSTIISMIIVLIVMAGVPLLFLGDGNIAEKLGFGGSGNKAAAPAKLPKNIKTVVTDKKVEVYTWVNEHGIKQFSNTPPPEGGASEKMVLSPDTNIVDGFKAPVKETEVASRPKVFSVGNPYTPGGMKEVIDNTMDVRESMNQRQADQDKMMEDLFKR